MEKYSVDRIEGGFAVVECNGEFDEIALSQLPQEVKEGCILIKDENGAYFIDKDETENTKRALFELQNSLFDE